MSSHRKICLSALIALVSVAAGWAAWRGGRTVLIVRRALPETADLSNKPPALVHEIDEATHTSRRLLDPISGLRRLAQLYHANGFYDEALRCYHALVRLEPREPRWPHLLANIESNFGRIPEAIPWEQRTVELAPTAPAARLRLADMLFKANRLDEAEAAYTKLHEIDPDNAYALLGLARIHLRNQQVQAARDALNQAVRAQPDFSAAWALLASIEEQSGNPTAAISARARSEVRFREMMDPWVDSLMDYCYDAYQLSVAADISKDPRRARSLLERAITAAPEVSAYRHQIAKLLITLKEKNLARQYLEQAVELAPTDSESWSTLITLLIETNDPTAGLAALTKALRLCPESGYLHFLNGNRLMKLSRLEEAEQELKTAQRLQPAEIRSYIQLSFLYVKSGRFQEALTEARGAIAADPANPTVMNMLARLSIMVDDQPAAAGWIKKILTLPQPNHKEVAQLAAMYRKQYGRDPY